MSDKKRPIRTCVACRATDEKGALLRLVRSSTGEITIDLTGKKPGRGAYICCKAECVNAGVKKKRLERALRTVVPVEIVEKLLATVRENENADR